MEELPSISRMTPLALRSGLNLEITDKGLLCKARRLSLIAFKTGLTFNPGAMSILNVTDVAHLGSGFRLPTCAALPGTLRFEP